MSVPFEKKTIGSAIDLSIDFEDDLATGRSIVSCSVTALDCATGEAAATILEDSVGVVAGTVVTEAVTGGTAGRKYQVRFRATLDNGDFLEKDKYLFIED